MSFSFLRGKPIPDFFPPAFCPVMIGVPPPRQPKARAFPLFTVHGNKFCTLCGKEKKRGALPIYRYLLPPPCISPFFKRRGGGAAPSIYPENCHLPNKSERPSARRSVPSCMFCYQSRYVTKNAISPSPRFPPSPLDLFLAFVSRFCGKKVDK